jgi:hypothetical protein
MPAKLPPALAVLLILFLAAGLGGIAAMDLHELLDGLRTRAPRLMAGPGMFFGFMLAADMALLAGIIIDADLVRRAPAQADFTAMKVFLVGTVALLVLGHVLSVVLSETIVSDQLHRAGYVPCGTDARRKFPRTEWLLPDQPCTPKADR